MDAATLGGAILASAADAILATDRAGVIRFWNPGAVRVFGFSEAEAVGASLDLIIPERLRRRHWYGFDRTVATGETRYGAGDLLAVPAITRDGRQISVEFTIVLLRDGAGELTGMAAVLRDVTARFEENTAPAPPDRRATPLNAARPIGPSSGCRRDVSSRPHPLGRRPSTPGAAVRTGRITLSRGALAPDRAVNPRRPPATPGAGESRSCRTP